MARAIGRLKDLAGLILQSRFEEALNSAEFLADDSNLKHHFRRGRDRDAGITPAARYFLTMANAGLGRYAAAQSLIAEELPRIRHGQSVWGMVVGAHYVSLDAWVEFRAAAGNGKNGATPSSPMEKACTRFNMAAKALAQNLHESSTTSQNGYNGNGHDYELTNILANVENQLGTAVTFNIAVLGFPDFLDVIERNRELLTGRVTDNDYSPYSDLKLQR